MRLTDEQREREGDYQVAVALLNVLRRQGLLTEKEYKKARQKLGKRFSPVWGQYPELCPGN